LPRRSRSIGTIITPWLGIMLVALGVGAAVGPLHAAADTARPPGKWGPISPPNTSFFSGYYADQCDAEGWRRAEQRDPAICPYQWVRPRSVDCTCSKSQGPRGLLALICHLP
jgi:hypothetical protein